MPLGVIGTGFGRTGTMSLKLALEQLGFGPCYHMAEIMADPPKAEHWAAAAEGRPVDWKEVFAGYRSTTDWPACDYWRELTALWPEAKIVHTVRDADSWFRSTQETIFSPLTAQMAGSSSPIGQTMRAIIQRHFNGDNHDRATCIAAYERFNAEVIGTIPAEKLLVFNVAEGWEPLCRFLGVPVPETPFPRSNTTDDFRVHADQRLAKMKAEIAASPEG